MHINIYITLVMQLTNKNTLYNLNAKTNTTTTNTVRHIVMM